jgi:hypothetical protein
MLNFPEFIFHKELFIFGNNYNTGAAPAANEPLIKLQFFPEGGDMVTGLKSRVAFKATTGKSLPAQVKGYVTDNAGNKVTEFVAEHNGMGSFELEPEEGKTYTAAVPGANGAVLTFKLPSAKKDGVTLKTENNNPHKLFVVVDRSLAQKEKYNVVKVVAQVNHQLVYEAHLNLDQDQNAVAINKKGIPPGIMQVTAFDISNNPLAERLAFIENYEIASPTLQADTLNLKTRGKNDLSFALPATPHALAVSVTNAGTDAAFQVENTIASSLLLTSDLKGYIHEPGYYFRNKDQSTLRHLDLLLMTQGWRRFEWKKILNNEPAALKYPVESSIWLSGKVTKSDRNEVVKEGKVSIVIKGEDSTTILADAVLTDKGEFLLNDLFFRKKATVAYQGTNHKSERLIVDVHLLPSYIDTLKRSAYRPIADLDTVNLADQQNALAKYLLGQIRADTSGIGMLETVVVKTKRISKEDSLNNAYTTGAFSMGKSVIPEEYPFRSTFWQVLEASTPGIRVEGNPFDPNVYFSRSGWTNPFGTSGTDAEGESFGLMNEVNGIAYFLNEVNVSKDVINSLSMDDIALIKVLKNEAAAVGATQGAIAFYTKKGVPVKTSPYEKGFVSQQREGYAVIKQFYAPDPASIPKGSDARTTIYWNSQLRPSKDGRYHLRFFNNDLATALKVVIQGIDKTGKLIYTEKIIR